MATATKETYKSITWMPYAQGKAYETTTLSNGKRLNHGLRGRITRKEDKQQQLRIYRDYAIGCGDMHDVLHTVTCKSVIEAKKAFYNFYTSYNLVEIEDTEIEDLPVVSEVTPETIETASETIKNTKTTKEITKIYTVEDIKWTSYLGGSLIQSYYAPGTSLMCEIKKVKNDFILILIVGNFKRDQFITGSLLEAKHLFIEKLNSYIKLQRESEIIPEETAPETTPEVTETISDIFDIDIIDQQLYTDSNDIALDDIAGIDVIDQQLYADTEKQYTEPVKFTMKSMFKPVKPTKKPSMMVNGKEIEINGEELGFINPNDDFEGESPEEFAQWINQKHPKAQARVHVGWQGKIQIKVADWDKAAILRELYRNRRWDFVI